VQEFATHPYRALDLWRSPVLRQWEQDGLSTEFARLAAKNRESYRPPVFTGAGCGEIALPRIKSGAGAEVLVQLRNAHRGRRRQHVSIRFGKDVEVHRSHQAVTCRKRYVGEPGKPLWTSRENSNGMVYV
jgi:hypothetical protein